MQVIIDQKCLLDKLMSAHPKRSRLYYEEENSLKSPDDVCAISHALSGLTSHNKFFLKHCPPIILLHGHSDYDCFSLKSKTQLCVRNINNELTTLYMTCALFKKYHGKNLMKRVRIVCHLLIYCN